MLSTGVKLIISLLILVLIFLFGLSALFWENRIKPHIWPKIPNPKSALEQLYMKPNKVTEVSFNPYSFLDVMVSRVDTIQVKGARMCHLNLTPVSDAAECDGIITERELLLMVNPIVEMWECSIRSSAPHTGEETPEPQDGQLMDVEPGGGDPMSDWASGPPPCLSPGVQPHGSAGTSHNSLVPLTGGTPDEEAACVEQSGQGIEGTRVRGMNLGSTIPSNPVVPPDESYITMSNLYKIQ
ncbi:uncharacterized protein LOC121276715 [Carcharodon carcharias]|uniref:uncharacterized protein LOC121276715 n=1 Tax=Carcharodon carcharias TaxID=13397 RepID=UPI001B7ED154|nr:uncharacterized protein LOC121276715 [Carcharodon carcharias]